MLMLRHMMPAIREDNCFAGAASVMIVDDADLFFMLTVTAFDDDVTPTPVARRRLLRYMI